MTSPYIVTTKQPDLVSAQVRNMRGGLVLSRLAVATLGEAKRSVRSVISHHDDETIDLGDALVQFGGGSITLPDGTVIEVEQTTWDQLAKKALSYKEYHDSGTYWAEPSPDVQQRILDAWNAKDRQ